jgi:hypothetical protein
MVIKREGRRTMLNKAIPLHELFSNGVEKRR